MINKRKVRLMARTAMYLKHEGTEDIPKSKYYRKDYVSLHMWLTAIAVTIAYFLLLILIACCNFENLINRLTTMNYTVLLVVIILGYIAMMLILCLLHILFIHTDIRNPRTASRYIRTDLPRFINLTRKI